MSKFKKTERTIRPIVKYLRELSIVVTGIAITVGTGLWVNYRNNEKAKKEYLDSIKMELEQNIENFELYAKWMQKSVKYADYLKSNDKTSLNEDSLAYYAFSSEDGCGYDNILSRTSMFSTNAFEMLKFSGVMRQTKGKELLIIWGVYSQIEEIKLFFDKSFQLKEREWERELQLLAEGKPIAVPKQNFYTSNVPYEIVLVCKMASEIIKNALSTLEEAKKEKQ